MSQIELNSPLLEQGIRSPHLFNGRLLSAEDLLTERTATLRHLHCLGEAIGAGVVCGLEVSLNPSLSTRAHPVVTIRAGSAINPKGHCLCLPELRDLVLAPSAEAAAEVHDEFYQCDRTPASLPLTGTGAYLLVISPVVARQGRAPVSGLGQGGRECNFRFDVEGVRFRLLDLLDAAELAAVHVNHRRNHIAWRCLGLTDPTLVDFMKSPFTRPAPAYGRLDELRPNRLTPCDVPLAIVYWSTGEGVEFVDNWSVRRRPVYCAANSRWAHVFSDRRVAEGEAALLQFEEHIDALLALGTDLSNVTASDHFREMPPAGLLPIGGLRFRVPRFFQAFTREERVTDFCQLRWLLELSRHREPISVANPPPLEIYSFEETNDFVLFVCGAMARPPVEPEPAPEPDPEPTHEPTCTAELIVTVSAAGKTFPEAGKSGQDQYTRVEMHAISYAGHAQEEMSIPFDLADAGVDPQVIGRIWLQDQHGREWLPESTTGRHIVKGAGVHKTHPVYLRRPEFHFLGLEGGKYFLKITARGFEPFSEQVVLRKCERKRSHALLVPARVVVVPPRKPPKRPPFDIWIDYLGNRWKPTLIPFDPREKVPWPDPGYIDPAPDQAGWLQDQVRDLLKGDPTLPLTLSEPRILIDPEYTPGKAIDEPAAYLVTEGGYALPMVLTPMDQALPASVAPSRAGIAEIGSDLVASTLAGSALASLDVMAHAWSGLVADTLGVPVENARSLQSELRTQAADLRQNLTYYGGLSADDGQRLRTAGFDDVKIANSSKAELSTALEREISDAEANALVRQARSFVPRNTWSPKDANLPLNDTQLKTLETVRIDSIGELQRRANADEAGTRGKLGMTESDFGAFRTRLGTELDRASVSLMEENPLTGLSGVRKETAAVLVRTGIDSITKLGDASPTDVAATLGIPEAEATALIRSAAKATLVERGGMDANQVEIAFTTTNSVRLSDLQKVDVRATLGQAGMSAVSDKVDVVRPVSFRNLTFR
jgi:hypothetical protein